MDTRRVETRRGRIIGGSGVVRNLISLVVVQGSLEVDG